MKNASPAAALLIALLVPLAAVAAEPAPSESTAAEAEAAPPAAAKDAKPARQAPKDCTASRIRKDKSQDCAKSATPTTSYSKDDLDRTGQMNVGDALKQLDPRFY